jgi:hypothetical protein
MPLFNLRSVRPCLAVALLAACNQQPSSTDSGGSEGTGTLTSSTSGALTTGTAETSTAETSTTTSEAPTSTSAAPGESSSGDSGDTTTPSSTSDPVDSTSSTTGDPPDPSTTTGDPDPGGALVVVNPGFEADNVANGTYNDKIVPAGWTKYDPQNIIGQDYNSLGVLNPTGTILYPGGAPEGSNVALVFLWRDQTSGMPAGFVQQLADDLQANTQYTLRVQVGNIAPMGNVPFDLAGFPGYRVELLAGDVVLAADDDTLAPTDGTFLQSEVTFTTGDDDAQLGAPLAIRLINLNKGDSGIEVNFDDVTLHAAPSP